LWTTPVADIGRIVHEVITPTEVVRVMPEVPPATLYEVLVVVQFEAVADTSKLIKAVQHLRALPRCRAVSAPEHSGRKLVNRTIKPSAVASVTDPVAWPVSGGHDHIVAGDIDG
jgi:hypothetical protein